MFGGITRNYVSPHREEDTYWLIYTESEGAEFQVTGTTPGEYLEIMDRGWFTRRTGDLEPPRIHPAFMMIVKAIDGFDFVIDEINERNGYN